MRQSAAVFIAVVVALSCAPQARTRAPRELWLYQGANLADSGSAARVESVWRRAAAAGYTKVVLVDPKFARLAEQDPPYFARVNRLRVLAAELNLEIVPGVCIVGRGNGAMLAMDPNLAESLPVRDAAFEVRGGIARIVASPPVTLAARPDRIDPGVKLSGGDAVIPSDSRSRLAFEVDVAPFRCYHVSVRLRGEGFRGVPRVRVTGGGRELAFASIAAPAGSKEEARDAVFNSLDNRHVTVSFSVARGASGTLHWSGWRMDEAGPVNLVRRPGMAFSFDGLAEGRDFDPVQDPLLGNVPWKGQFDVWHEPPAIHVRRPDGTKLRASWYHAAVLLRGQVACCLSDSAVLARLHDEVARVRELFVARTVFLMHDEIRAIGWDAPCKAGGRSAGAILAANVRACRAFAGDAAVCVWNDMFDPNHNAVSGYYLARGDLAGSWEGLDRDVVVVNWNPDRLDASLKFFAGRGHRQVYAGYYDGDVEEIRNALPRLDAVEGVTSVMYTTWRDRYDDLERFAAICRGER